MNPLATSLKFEYLTNSIEFESGASYPERDTHQKYQVVDRSAGGQLHVETLGVSRIIRTLLFQNMSQTDYDALVDWFDNIVNGAEIAFTFTDEYGDSGTVRIIDSTLNFKNVSLGRFSGTLSLEFV